MKLLPPCSYQGAKQRIAPAIVDAILDTVPKDAMFFDLCCGSGTISLELVSRGIATSHISMCDIGSWGQFWETVANGKFDIEMFKDVLSQLPADKNMVKPYLDHLASQPIDDMETYTFLLLQAGSFGGKQVTRIGSEWHHSGFRSYWQPTPTTVRQSPVNPIQPQPEELVRRMEKILRHMAGIQAYHCNAMDMADIIKGASSENPNQPICIYIDPPYAGTTDYYNQFSPLPFIRQLKQTTEATIFVSEGCPLSNRAVRLRTPRKGGITAKRAAPNEEWLSQF